jgi:hypothetical protein
MKFKPITITISPELQQLAWDQEEEDDKPMDKAKWQELVEELVEELFNY